MIYFCHNIKFNKTPRKNVVNTCVIDCASKVNNRGFAKAVLFELLEVSGQINDGEREFTIEDISADFIVVDQVELHCRMELAEADDILFTIRGLPHTGKINDVYACNG